MIQPIRRPKKSLIHRLFSFFLILIITLNFIIPVNLSYAQVMPLLNLPLPGSMVGLTPGYNPVLIKGITLYPNNPLEFDFLINSGNSDLQGDALKDEANKLIKYFLASLTVPEEDLWVNLSPYEKDRIVAPGLGITEMGRDLLAQDYVLKQLTASLVYPEDNLGKEFWERVYKKAQEKFGTTDIPMNTFNKIWIVPNKAVVYEKDNNVFVIESSLKVMLEEDYLALQKNLGNKEIAMDQIQDEKAQEINKVSSDVVREVLLPEIEKEVNEGKNFANLRQIHNSLILATWYKMNLRQSLLGQVYADKNKVKGVDVEDKGIKEKIYQQYLEAFKKGAYDYIKEDYDAATKQIISRQYFSGGADMREESKKIDEIEYAKGETPTVAQAATFQKRNAGGEDLRVHEVTVEANGENPAVVAQAQARVTAEKVASETGDAAAIGGQLSLWPELENPYWTGMKKRIRDLDGLPGANKDLIANLEKPAWAHQAWLTVDLVDNQGQPYKAEIFTVRVANNFIKGPAKGGIRYVPASDLMRVEHFREAFIRLKASNPNADQEVIKNFIKQWITEEAKALSLGMTLKDAGMNLPLGGGKAAVFIGKIVQENGEWVLQDYDPWEQMSANNKALIARAHSRDMAKSGIVGVDIDIPAPDVRTTGQILSWYEDEYLKYLITESTEIQSTDPKLYARLNRKLTDLGGHYHPTQTPLLEEATQYWMESQANGEYKPVPWLGVYTGKPIEPVNLGGALGRTEATGEGVGDVMKAYFGRDLKGKTAAIQGFGNVGSYLARRLVREGVILKVINDVGGTYVKPAGWTEAEIQALMNKGGLIRDAIDAHVIDGAGVQRIEGNLQAQTAAVLEAVVDIVIPAAQENQITKENAPNIQAKYVVEAANGPTMAEADPILKGKGVIVIPDTLANAGGVDVSFLETKQVKYGRRFALEEVNARRRKILSNALTATRDKMRENTQLTMRQAYDLVALENIVRSQKLFDPLQRAKDPSELTVLINLTGILEIRLFRWNEPLRLRIINREATMMELLPQLERILKEKKTDPQYPQYQNIVESIINVYLDSVSNGEWSAERLIAESDFQDWYDQGLKKGEKNIISQIQMDFDGINRGDPRRQWLYEWLQNHPSNLAKEALHTLGINWQGVVRKLLNMALMRDTDGNIHSAARQLQEIKEQGTLGGIKVADWVVEEAKKNWGEHSELLRKAAEPSPEYAYLMADEQTRQKLEASATPQSMEFIKAVKDLEQLAAQAKNPGSLIIMGHAGTEWSPENLNEWAGWTNLKLSVEGQRQSLQVGNELRGLRLDRTYFSHLHHSLETLEFTLQGMGLENRSEEPEFLTASPAFNERSYGFLAGWDRDELQRSFPTEYPLWRRSLEARPPGGESLQDTIERTLPALLRNILTAVYQGKNIFIFGHGNNLRGVLVILRNYERRIKGLPLLTEEEIAQLEVPQAVPIGIHFEKGGFNFTEIWGNTPKNREALVRILNGDAAAIGEAVEEQVDHFMKDGGAAKFITDLEAAAGKPREQVDPVNPFSRLGFDPNPRLGWTPSRLDHLLSNRQVIQRTLDLGREIRGKFKYVILMGMGGFGLSAEVVKSMFGRPDSSTKIYSLRSTDPEAIYNMLEGIARNAGISVAAVLKQTLAIASSKSGTTTETLSYIDYLKRSFTDASLNPVERVWLMTDPDSAMDKAMKAKAARNDPSDPAHRVIYIQLDGETDIGGRFTSPLTNIFLLPLAILAPDRLETILIRAQQDRNKYTGEQAANDPYIRLGTFLHAWASTSQPRDQVTFLVPPLLRETPRLAEQLFEESNGKDGKGVTVHYDEGLEISDLDGPQSRHRVFVRINVGKQKTQEEFAQAAMDQEIPVFDINIESEDDIGAVMMGLQLAVANMAVLWDINFTNQPGVEDYKKATTAVMKDLESGKIKDVIPTQWKSAQAGIIKVFYSPLIEAGIFTEEELRQQVQNFGSTMEDAAAVYAASLLLAVKKGNITNGELAVYSHIPKAFEDILRAAQKDILIRQLGLATKRSEGPERNHSHQQHAQQGRNNRFTSVFLPEQFSAPADSALPAFNRDQIRAQAVGTVQALAKIQEGEREGRAAILVTLNQSMNKMQEADWAEASKFFNDVHGYLSRADLSFINEQTADAAAIGEKLIKKGVNYFLSALTALTLSSVAPEVVPSAQYGEISSDEMLLIRVALEGDITNVSELLRKGVDANAKFPKNGGTALIAASQNGHTDVVQALLAKGADVNVKMNNGATALIAASQEGHTDVVQALLAKDAEVNVKMNNGATALLQASQNGHAGIVQALLAKGAEVNVKRNDDGVTALIMASQNGHTDVVQALLAKDAEVNVKKNDDGVTALMLASKNGHTEVVQALLAKGAEVNLRDTDQEATALMLASQNGHADVVQALLAKGAEVNLRDTDQEATALMLASQNGHADVVRALLAKDADVNLKTSDGETALMLASQNGHAGIVQALLAKDADVNLKTNDGETALMLASQNGHVDVVRALLAKGAEVNVKMNNGGTALSVATKPEIIELLKKAGAVKGSSLSTPKDTDPAALGGSDDEQARKSHPTGHAPAAIGASETRPLANTGVEIKFGTSGWRGRIGLDFIPKNVYRAAQGVADYFNKHTPGKTIFLVYDTRRGNAQLIREVAEIFAGNGINVEIVAEESTPTPVAAYVASSREDIGGIVNLTASHSPSTDDGFKFSPGHGGAADKATTDEISAFSKQAREYKWRSYANALGEGLIKEVKREDIVRSYIHEYIIPEMERQGAWDDIVNYIKTNPDFRVILDPMQGTAVEYMRAVYGEIAKAAGREFFTMIHINNNDPDFKEVNGEPRPDGEKSNRALVEAVASRPNTVGILADGDMDRFGIVDFGGRLISANILLALRTYFRFTELGQRGVVGKTVATSNFVNAVAEHFGLEIDEEKVGFKWFVENVVKKGRSYLVAGEESAHAMEKGFEKSWDDGLVMGLMGLWTIARTNKSLANYQTEIESVIGRKFYTKAQNIRGTDDSIKDKANERTKLAQQETERGVALVQRTIVLEVERLQGQKVKDLITKDGIKIVFESGDSMLMRPSGTEFAIMKLYVEVTDESRADELLQAGEQIIRGEEENPKTVIPTKVEQPTVEDDVGLSFTLNTRDQFGDSAALGMKEIFAMAREKAAYWRVRLNLPEKDESYLQALYAKYLQGRQALMIGSTFLPSAMITDFSAVNYRQTIAGNPTYLARAKGATVVANPLDAGKGTSFKREETLKRLQPFGRTAIGAKSQDSYFEYVEVDGFDQNGKAVKVRENISVLEMKVLHYLDLARQGIYKNFILEEFVNPDSRGPINEFLDSPYLWDRVDQRIGNLRTYRQVIAETAGIELAKEWPEQQNLPTIDAGTMDFIDSKDPNAFVPGGHGFLAYTSLQVMATTLPQAPDQIRVLYNGDGTNNFVPEDVAGWMLVERIPVVMLTTIKMGLDKKGGLMGEEVLADGKRVPQMFETAQAKRSGQEELFSEMGLSVGNPGTQLFNTNVAAVNESLLHSFLEDLMAIVGEGKFAAITTPDLITSPKTKKIDNKDVNVFQLEGAMGSALLNLNKYLMTLPDPEFAEKIRQLMRHYGITRLVHFVNFDPADRPLVFTPEKYTYDHYLYAATDLFKVDPKTGLLIYQGKSGQLPGLELHPYYEDLENDYRAFGHPKEGPGLSIKELNSLTIRRKVHLAHSIVNGHVILDGDPADSNVIDLNGSRYTGILPRSNGRLLLDNVYVRIENNGDIHTSEITTLKGEAVQRVKQLFSSRDQLMQLQERIAADLQRQGFQPTVVNTSALTADGRQIPLAELDVTKVKPRGIKIRFRNNSWAAFVMPEILSSDTVTYIDIDAADSAEKNILQETFAKIGAGRLEVQPPGDAAAIGVAPIDQATQATPVGGINLDPKLLDLQIKRDGNGVPLPLPMQPIGDMKIEGFFPVIINITPVSLPLLLGLNTQETPTDDSDVEQGKNKYYRDETEVISSLN